MDKVFVYLSNKLSVPHRKVSLGWVLFLLLLLLWLYVGHLPFTSIFTLHTLIHTQCVSRRLVLASGRPPLIYMAN